MPVFKIEFKSYHLDRAQTVNVYVPNEYTGDYSDLDVVFLLHGMQGFQNSWMYYGNALRTADKYQVVLIMPSEENSFGLPGKNGCNYEGYLIDEVFKNTRKWLNLTTKKEKTYIAGLSMGGYMAISLALKYPNLFSYCGAFSPVVDLTGVSAVIEHVKHTPFAKVLEGVFGGIDMINSDVNLINPAKNKKDFPRLYLYCGTKDGLYEGCKTFANLLKENNQDITFVEDDGAHTWDRWEKQLIEFLERR